MVIVCRSLVPTFQRGSHLDSRHFKITEQEKLVHRSCRPDEDRLSSPSRDEDLNSGDLYQVDR